MGLYVHIPFCKKKCNYCDFASYAGKEELIDGYVDALVREITNSPHFNVGFPNQQKEIRPHNKLWGISTIFIGGGTPTLLEPRHFKKIMASLPLSQRERGNEGVRAFETTAEANPGTANKAKLKELRKLGINRLSIGAQSFNDKHLKTLGRIHEAKDIFRFYADARSAGFDNINLDLIFALPGQTLDEWKKDLETAIDLAPDHLSTYNLQIEEGTVFWQVFNMLSSDTPKTRTFSQGEKVPSRDTLSLWERVRVLSGSGEGLNLPSEDAELAMYEHTIETLTAAGFRHYEISNFARPGFECQHNINYWKNGNYIGIGAGAHSHVNGKRWANPITIEEYLSDAKRSTPDDPHFATDQRETIFMGLRLLEGLPAEKFRGFENEVTELIASGLLARVASHIKLTRKGLYLGNMVFEKFV